MSEAAKQMLAQAEVDVNDGMECLYGENIGNLTYNMSNYIQLSSS